MKLRFSEGGLVDVRLDDVRGRTCTLDRDAGNAHFHAAAGTRWTIKSHAQGKGFALEGETCATCKLDPRITAIPYLDVTIDGAPPARGKR